MCKERGRDDDFGEYEGSGSGYGVECVYWFEFYLEEEGTQACRSHRGESRSVIITHEMKFLSLGFGFAFSLNCSTDFEMLDLPILNCSTEWTFVLDLSILG